MKQRYTIQITKPSDQPIDCNKHDYIEIACMYRYKLVITLKSGRTIKANAITTQTKATKIEYFVVENEESIFEIPMTELAKLETVSDSASFKTISFS